jgi:hypothetical protein
MSVAASINILLRGNTTDLDKKLQIMEQKLRDFAGMFSRVTEFFLEQSKAAFKDAIALGRVAERLDIIPEKLAGISLAAKVAGQDFEAITSGLQKMLVAVSGSGDPLKKAQSDKAFNQLKLSAESIKNLSPDQMFMRIADAMQHVENVADRVNIAKSLFGRGGVPLLNIIHEGSKGLEQFQKVTEFLGTNLKSLDIKKFEELNLWIKLVWESIKGASLAIVKALIPTLKVLAVIGMSVGITLKKIFDAFGDVLIRLIELLIIYKASVWATVAAERAWATVSAIGAAIREGGWKGMAGVVAKISAVGGVVYMLNKAFEKLKETISGIEQNLPKAKEIQDIEMPDFMGKGLQNNHPGALLKGSVEAYSAVVNAGSSPMSKIETNTKKTAVGVAALVLQGKGKPLLAANFGGTR